MEVNGWRSGFGKLGPLSIHRVWNRRQAHGLDSLHEKGGRASGLFDIGEFACMRSYQAMELSPR